jgi:hypothetical protein
MIAVGVILGCPHLPWPRFAAVTHAVFGALGGLLGAVILRQLRRIPYFARSSEPRPAASPSAPGGRSA